MNEFLLLIVLLLIFYDFSLHFLRLSLGLEKARKIRFYWPTFLIENQKRYEIFWTVYWLVAFVLLLIYLTL